jgi:protein O-mannosyl-transferase
MRRARSAETMVRRAREGRVWIALGLLALTLLAFAPMEHAAFLNWDDPAYVTDNAVVAQGLTSQGLVWAFTTTHASNWHPLTWLSHMFDVWLAGMDAGSHHVTNLALHACNVLLLFVVLAGLTRAPWRSAIVAGLFGVHPLHVESVAWIAERKDLLSATFFLLAIGAYARYVRQPSVVRYGLVAISMALGLMAKPMVVTLPLVLLLLDWWPLQRDVPLRRLMTEKLPLVALSVASTVVTFLAQRHGGAVASLVQWSWIARVENACIAYVTYLLSTVWPVDLAALYPMPLQVSTVAAVLSALVLIVITLLVWRARGTSPYLPVGWFWYLGTLLPVIGLIQIGSQSRADRYTYLPLIGIFVLVVWGVADLVARWRVRETAAVPVACGVLLGFALVSRQQTQYWMTSEALWQRALSVTTDNAIAHASLADVLAQRGDTDRAIAEYREAIRIRSGLDEAHVNLANLLADRGATADARREYMTALELRPGNAYAHLGLGVTLEELGDREGAIAQYRDAIRIDPDFAEAHNSLGSALAARDQLEDALREYETAVRLRSTDADFVYNMGVVQERLNRVADARRSYETALHLDPRHASARRALDNLLRRGGG